MPAGARAAAGRQPSRLGVLLVHPHPAARIGLRQRLARRPGWTVVGEAATAAEALAQVRQRHPALVLVDLALGEAPALELIGALAGRNRPGVVVLSDGSQPLLLAQALRAGARGVLPPDLPAAELPLLLAAMATRRTAGTARPLTERQRAIVACIARGYSNRRIAAALGVSVHTVKHHLSRLFDRLGVTSRLELLRLLHGLAPLPAASPAESSTPPLHVPPPTRRPPPASSL